MVQLNFIGLLFSEKDLILHHFFLYYRKPSISWHFLIFINGKKIL